MFVPTLPLLEVFIRGSVIFLAVFFSLRVLRREAGQIGIADLLVMVIIADAVQNGLANEYKSITEALFLALTIIGWDFLLDWLAYRSPLIRKLIRPPPLQLIRNGRLVPRNLKRELITEEELIGRLRAQGIDEVTKVKSCFIEGDGEVSVIPRT
jgi:uncharacterized membrane protein YcaP (DUF421 family)